MLHLTGRGFIFNEHNERRDPIEALGRLYQAESSMISTYKECMPRIESESHAALGAQCLALHEANAAKLAARIQYLGGEVPVGFDLWRMAGSIVSDVAAAISQDAVMETLSKSEMSLFEEYEEELQSFDDDNLLLIQEDLMRSQQWIMEQMQSKNRDLQAGAAADAPPATL